MMWYKYPNIPWIQYSDTGRGGFFVQDTRTNETFFAADENQVHQFAADRSRSQEHYGIGDFIHSITKSLGLTRCEPCAKRQAMLNNFIKK
jgi:hypothetical protein